VDVKRAHSSPVSCNMQSRLPRSANCATQPWTSHVVSNPSCCLNPHIHDCSFTAAFQHRLTNKLDKALTNYLRITCLFGVLGVRPSRTWNPHWPVPTLLFAFNLYITLQSVANDLPDVVGAELHLLRRLFACSTRRIIDADMMAVALQGDLMSSTCCNMTCKLMTPRTSLPDACISHIHSSTAQCISCPGWPRLGNQCHVPNDIITIIIMTS
jgi:hypothetical protein